MNEQALFCDGTGAYVIPPQPDANEVITLRFRTAKDDVDAVRLLTRDAKYDLQKVYTKGEFDFYEVNWRMGEVFVPYGQWENWWKVPTNFFNDLNTRRLW